MRTGAGGRRRIADDLPKAVDIEKITQLHNSLDMGRKVADIPMLKRLNINQSDWRNQHARVERSKDHLLLFDRGGANYARRG
jgi:hypothetical protein